jgi:hypothetical protein
MRYCPDKAFLRHPDNAMGVRCKMGSFRMRGSAIEDIRYGFTLIGSQCSYVHERFHPFVMDGSDHRTRICMPHQDDRAIHPLDDPVQSCSVIPE